MKFYSYADLFIGHVQYKKICHAPDIRIFTIQKEYDYYILTSVDQISIEEKFVCYLTKEGIDHPMVASIGNIHSLYEMTQRNNKIRSDNLIQISESLRNYFWICYGVGESISQPKRQRN